MHYQYRDIGFEGKTVRFIKSLNFNSDGLEIGPIDQLYKIATAIEQTEPETIVVVMLGRSDISVNRSNTDWAHFMAKFWRSYRRLPDDYYEWDSAEG
jgi:hypothetical protein